MPMNQGKEWTFNTVADTYEKIRPGGRKDGPFPGGGDPYAVQFRVQPAWCFPE